MSRGRYAAGRSKAGPRYRAVNLVAFGLLLSLTLALGFARIPASGEDSVHLGGHRLPALCLTRLLTGRPCSGCGTTRALVLVFDGRMAEARAIHPSAPWLGAWLCVQLLARLILAALAFRLGNRWFADLMLSLLLLLAAAYLPLL